MLIFDPASTGVFALLKGNAVSLYHSVVAATAACAQSGASGRHACEISFAPLSYSPAVLEWMLMFSIAGFHASTTWCHCRFPCR
jgi:hypothetical protein